MRAIFPPGEPDARASEEDDRTIVERCRDGDRDAFRCLVQRYYKKVYAVAFGVVRSADDALDITQETFLKVYRNLDRFHGSSSFYTWLYRIAVNLCIDHLRKEGKHQALDYDDGLQHSEPDPGLDGPAIAPSGPATPLQALQCQELREQIIDAVGKLSVNHRAVLLLRELEGLSYEEISQALECSKGTVMSRLHHARIKVRKMLRPYLGGDAASLFTSTLE